MLRFFVSYAIKIQQAFHNIPYRFKQMLAFKAAENDQRRRHGKNKQGIKTLVTERIETSFYCLNILLLVSLKTLSY